MAPRSTTLPSAQTESARELRRNFFCDLCNKGYARITELEAHENSYDHQHRKRMKEMKQITRNPTAAVRASRSEKKRNENEGMISLNLQATPKDTGKSAEGRPRGFRDIGAPRVDKEEGDAKTAASVPDVAVNEAAAKEEEVLRPIRWDDLPSLYTKLDSSTLPPEWQQQAPSTTDSYLATFGDAEKRNLYFEDDEDILDELGIGDDDWIADEGQGTDAEIDLDDDWEDYMQSDEWKRQKNKAEDSRREKLVHKRLMQHPA